MRSSKHGEITSVPEVTNISQHGFWLYMGSKEYFLPFEKFHWFRDAAIKDITNIELQHGTHLYWPTLDVDLSVEILENPDKYKKTFK